MREYHILRSTPYRWFAQYQQLLAEVNSTEKELEHLWRKQEPFSPIRNKAAGANNVYSKV